MNVAIIGAGRMGGSFARLLSGKHRVSIGSRDAATGAAHANELGAERGGSYADAVEGADVVFLCVPWSSVDATLQQLGDLAGTTLVDITNPYVSGSLQLHADTSNAEIIQAKTPQAHVVKGWNTIFSAVAADPPFDGVAPAVFLAGDDANAKRTVATLARDMGYDPVDCGPLQSSRDLERLLSLLGTIGANLEWGRWSLRVLTR